MSEKLLIKNYGKLRVLIFNNPSKKNAMDIEIASLLCKALQDAASDDSVNVVALTGMGDSYSAGGNLIDKSSMTYPQEILFSEVSEKLSQLIRSYYTFPKLLIGVINGACIGIGATTAALCDILYASDKAYFLTPFTKMGLCAEGCSSYTFPRIMGQSKAMEMLLLNHKMSAVEALQFNLVAEVFKHSEIDTKLWPKLKEISKMSPAVLCTSKRLVRNYEIQELENALARELKELEIRWKSKEFMEAIMNFMNHSKM